MNACKESELKILLESTAGVHLTVYMNNQDSQVNLKSQLKKIINHFHEILDEAMSAEQRNDFIAPLNSLLLDTNIFNEMKDNVGIFLNKNFFKILNIPVYVDHSFHIATSFHIKPLLAWIQFDQSFLYLGIDKNSANFYSGNQSTIKLIDSLSLPDSFINYLNSDDQGNVKNDLLTWLSDLILKFSKNQTPKLFVAANASCVEFLNSNLIYKGLISTPIALLFDKEIKDVYVVIKQILREDSRNAHEKKLIEFRIYESDKRTIKNLFEISRSVFQGKVHKLIITDELNIFGKIDKNHGGLSIHPFDLNHEDDDILDDLAQMVLSQGGEVVVASIDEIPNGRPILAILDDDGIELEKIKFFSCNP